MISLLTAEAKVLTNKARFIKEICEKKLVITNKKKAVLIEMLEKEGYDADPMEAWKKSRMTVDQIRHEEEQKENKDSDEKDSASKYNYLLSMPLWSLTKEKIDAMLKKKDEKLTELETVKNTTIEQMWLNDLEVFEDKYDQIREQEQKEVDNEKPVAGLKSKGKKESKKAIALKKEVMPSKDAERIVPDISGFKAAGPKREKKASGEKKVKKEKKDIGKGSKKMTDYGFKTVKKEMKNMSLSGRTLHEILKRITFLKKFVFPKFF